MPKKVQVVWQEVPCVWLRGNQISGALTRGGASATILYHADIMIL